MVPLAIVTVYNKNSSHENGIIFSNIATAIGRKASFVIVQKHIGLSLILSYAENWNLSLTLFQKKNQIY